MSMPARALPVTGERLLEMYCTPMSMQAIAAMFGCSNNLVWRRLGVIARYPGPITRTDEWICGYCGSTEEANIKWARQRTKRWDWCRRCSAARVHHVPRLVYCAWLERGCFICGTKSRLHIDHAHCKGARSCRNCGLALKFRDDHEIRYPAGPDEGMDAR